MADLKSYVSEFIHALKFEFLVYGNFTVDVSARLKHERGSVGIIHPLKILCFGFLGGKRVKQCFGAAFLVEGN